MVSHLVGIAVVKESPAPGRQHLGKPTRFVLHVTFNTAPSEKQLCGHPAKFASGLAHKASSRPIDSWQHVN